MRPDALRWIPIWSAVLLILASAAGGSGGGGDDEESGIGGTGLVGDDGGIGGTGLVGGDGGIGGTGIVGTITSFGSIHVNGLTVEYDAATPVEFDGQPGRAEQLALGHVVAVEASRRGSELRADEIAVHHAVIGPVAAVDPESSRLRVLDREVEIGAGTATFDAASGRPLDPAELVPGAFVRVSGLLRGDGVIVASRVERAPVSPERSLRGPIADFGPGIRRLSLEGYLHDEGGDGILRLEGFELDASGLEEGMEALRDGVRVHLSGTRSGARGLRVERIHIDRGLHDRDGVVHGDRAPSRAGPAAGKRPHGKASRPPRPIRPGGSPRPGR